MINTIILNALFKVHTYKASNLVGWHDKIKNSAFDSPVTDTIPLHRIFDTAPVFFALCRSLSSRYGSWLRSMK